jgi:DNA-binding MarR family transcriptional regulator
VRDLHAAIMDIVSIINRPQRDAAMIRRAGVRLDRALFPLLVGIGRFGPIGVVELADRAGRDYTTISRQVAKLEALGLVRRRDSAKDRRVREAVITPAGLAMTERLDAARVEMGEEVFRAWKKSDIDALVRLTRRLADGMASVPEDG